MERKTAADFPVGGYPGDDEKGRELQSKLDPKKTPRYDEAAATLAWQRTIEFFDRTLR